MLDFPSPPVTAYGAKPLTVEEIDAHPDRDRIWATIMALRDEADKEAQRQYDEGFEVGAELGAP